MTSLTASVTRVEESGRLSTFASAPSTAKYGASVFSASAPCACALGTAEKISRAHSNDEITRSDRPNMSKSFRRPNAGVAVLTATDVLAGQTRPAESKAAEKRAEFAARVRRVGTRTCRLRHADGSCSPRGGEVPVRAF